jgi:benzoate transport
MSSDPREVINQSKMSILQWGVIAVTIALNSLDGFDILSISFASTGIAKEWHINKTLLGLVMSMELIGMGLGSFFIGNIADRIGRRRTILICLAIMACGMFMVTTTGSILVLSVWRIITGIGIGGLLPAINATAAEFSNLKRRHLSISLMAIGYPLGGVFGGKIASALLAQHDWRSVFYLGAAMTAFMIPVFYAIVPESVHWLTQKQPAGALEEINRILRKFKRDAVAALPRIGEQASRKSGDIFSPRFMKATVIITTTYILHIMTYYFILKWVPNLVEGMGFARSSAGDVLVWVNVGGALGGTIFGLLTLKFDLKKLSLGVLFFSAVSIAVFGHSPADLSKLSLFAMMAGFFGNVGIIALYAVVAHAYPTHARAFGTGFMLAIGRGGAILSPILVGFLLDKSIPLPSVGLIMSVGSLAGCMVLFFLKLESGEEADKKVSAAGR